MTLPFNIRTREGTRTVTEDNWYSELLVQLSGFQDHTAVLAKFVFKMCEFSDKHGGYYSPYELLVKEWLAANYGRKWDIYSESFPAFVTGVVQYLVPRLEELDGNFKRIFGISYVNGGLCADFVVAGS